MTIAVDVDSGQSWYLAGRVSPRQRVRLADVDPSTGRPINSYSGELSLRADAPSLPYAVHLAKAGLYWLLAWDLDADRGPVEQDLAQLRGLLETAGIPYLVARSGPGGGRHVWCAIAGGAPAELIARMARAMARLLPTLDIAPLTNAPTGAVRPPGAPHRTHGRSEIIEGDWSVLTDPSARAEHVELLMSLLPAAPVVQESGRRGTSVDGYGHRHLSGTRHTLPPAARRALSTPPAPDADHSAVLWAVLLGGVRARWHHQDVVDLLGEAPERTPGLEYLRTANDVGGRRVRSAGERGELLARQWDRAVAYVAASGPGEGESDATYLGRLDVVVQDVTALQARADASLGRWARPGGRADRRVLDHVCVVALTAVRSEVALDVRSLAHATGLGRETARTALERLAVDGWLCQVAPGLGAEAAIWTIGSKTAAEGFSTENEYWGRSHVVPPPAGSALPTNSPTSSALPARRDAWLSRLTHRLALQAHDVFVGLRLGGLGHEAGAVWAALEMSGPTSIDTVARTTGTSSGRARQSLEALAVHRLARRGARGLWRALSSRGRVRAARTIGTYGTLARRVREAVVDRQVWAWWRAEVEWMHTPAAERPERAKAGRRRRPGPGQLALAGTSLTARLRHGPYPRHPGRGGASGRADHTAARAQLLARTS